ncbi:MAG: hypothetical protein JF632_08805 [Acidobacteria bacterium]|nr:hypothetical protein [Acidobacteriota bacterium]
MASRRAEAVRGLAVAMCVCSAIFAGGCATSSALHEAERAERAHDYDRAVVEYTKAVRAKPDDRGAQLALDRARLRAAQEHFFRGRRLSAAERHEEALMEFQVASELSPTSTDIEAALRDTRLKVRAKVAASREGKTELQSLIPLFATCRLPSISARTRLKMR